MSDGLFSVLLGSVEPLPQLLFDQNSDLWLAIAVGGDDEMSPRDKIASAPYAFSGGVPSGVIVMWSGPVSAVPEGWSLCDGTSGTPDLRDMFIVGAGGSYSVGDAGGTDAVSLDVDEMPTHSHPVALSEEGEHQHGYSRFYIGGGGAYKHSNYLGYAADGYQGSSTALAGVHSHTATVDTVGGTEPHENRPPYYSLAFIYKQ